MLRRVQEIFQTSIKFKVALTTFLAVSTVLFCVSWSFFFYFHNLLRDKIFQQQLVLVTEVSAQIDGRINLARHQLALACTELNDQVLADPVKLDLALGHISAVGMIFDAGFLVIGSDGRVLAESMEISGLAGTDLSYRDYVKEPWRTGKPYISVPFRSSLPGNTPLIAMAMPIRNNNDTIIGLLVGFHDLLNGNFLTALSSKGFGEGGYLYLLHERTVIMHPDRTRILEVIAEGKNRGIDQALGGWEGSLDNVNSKGKHVISSFRKIGETGWILAANTPYDEAFAPLKNMAANMLLISVGGLLLAMLAVWYVTRILTRPIGLLISHVDEISAVGGHWKPLELKTGDELERLANAFNDMMDEVRQATEALEESAETYRIVAEYTSEIAFWRTLDDSMRFISANCYDITGYRDAEFYAEPGLLDSLIHPDDRPLWKGGHPDQGEHDCPAPVQIRILTRNGATRWMHHSSHIVCNEAGQITGIRGSLSDITDTVLARQKLSEEKMFVENLINGASTPIFVISSDHRVLYWNRALEIITGTAAADLKGTDLHWSGFYAAQRATLADLAIDGNNQLDGLYGTYCASKYIPGGFQAEGWFEIGGQRRYLVFEAAPIRNSAGKIIAAIETLEDITERRQMEDELEKAYAELKEAQMQLFLQEKMASIGQLAAGVAHEINNPMGFISSNLGTLGKYLERLTEFIGAGDQVLLDCNCGEAADRLAEERKRLKVDYIMGDARQLIIESQDGAGRVRRIVQDLRNFSRVDQTAQELLNLNDSLETTINIAWSEIKYIATLNREFGDIPEILCYPQQLNQVFLNMLVNAGHAMEGTQGGSITVRTWCEGGDVFISVADTGCGIPDEIRKRIFEPFFTTKEVGKGTGLGLSISYDIIRKHGGEITVESAPGLGTTFVVRLPVKGIGLQAEAPSP